MCFLVDHILVQHDMQACFLILVIMMYQKRSSSSAVWKQQIWPFFIPAPPIFSSFFLSLNQVPRPDGKPDNLGLLVLDEPSTKQSDPTVLSLWLTENSKQHNVTVRYQPSPGSGWRGPEAPGICAVDLLSSQKGWLWFRPALVFKKFY